MQKLRTRHFWHFEHMPLFEGRCDRCVGRMRCMPKLSGINGLVVCPEGSAKAGHYINMRRSATWFLAFHLALTPITARQEKADAARGAGYLASSMGQNEVNAPKTFSPADAQGLTASGIRDVGTRTLGMIAARIRDES